MSIPANWLHDDVEAARAKVLVFTAAVRKQTPGTKDHNEFARLLRLAKANLARAAFEELRVVAAAEAITKAAVNAPGGAL